MDTLFYYLTWNAQNLQIHKSFTSFRVHYSSKLSDLFFKHSVYLVLQHGTADKSYLFCKKNVQHLCVFVPRNMSERQKRDLDKNA